MAGVSIVDSEFPSPLRSDPSDRFFHPQLDYLDLTIGQNKLNKTLRRSFLFFFFFYLAINFVSMLEFKKFGQLYELKN